MAQSFTVQKEDTVDRIARRFNVTSDRVTGFRSGDPNFLTRGETLTVDDSPLSAAVGGSNVADFENKPAPTPTTGASGAESKLTVSAKPTNQDASQSLLAKAVEGFGVAPANQPVQTTTNPLAGNAPVTFDPNQTVFSPEQRAATQQLGGVDPIQPVQGPVQGQPTVPPASTQPPAAPAATQAPAAPLQQPAPQPLAVAQTEPKTFTTPSGAVVGEGGNVISTPEGQSEGDAVNDVFSAFGLDSDKIRESFNFSPAQTVSGVVRQVYQLTDLPDIGSNSTNVINNIEELENERDAEIRKIQDNPFFSAGSKSQRIAQVDDRFEQRIGNRTNKLRLLQEAQSEARDQARFVAQTAIGLFDKNRTFQADQIDDFLNRIETAQKAEADLSKEEFSQGLDLAKLDVSRQRLALDQFKALQPSATQEKAAFERAEKDTISRQTQTDTIGLVNNILANPDLAQVTGKSRLGAGARLAGSAGVRGQLAQLKALTSLEGRSKLKGSGTISDFEANMLKDSANALNFAIQDDGRVAMSDVEVEQNLKNIRGVLRSKVGLSVGIIVTDVKTGESRLFSEQTRQDIEEISLDPRGFVIDYE